MHTNLWFWIAFNAGVLFVLAVDLFGFQRKAHAPSAKEAAIWTAVWVALSLGFNALIWYREGHAKALEFLTGYLVEYSLSVDNIFVFVLVFSYFAVPAAYQHRVLFWGILSALVLRGVMIAVGAALIQSFHWALYLFGAFLLFTGIKMLLSRRRAVDIARNPLIRLVRRLVPVSDSYHGAHFTVGRGGRLLLTPLAMVLIMSRSQTFSLPSTRSRQSSVSRMTRSLSILQTSALFLVCALCISCSPASFTSLSILRLPWRSSFPLSAPRSLGRRLSRPNGGLTRRRWLGSTGRY
jgi:TerC family integral membrane protein